MLSLVAVAVFCIAMAAIASGPSGGFIVFLSHPATAAWAQAIGALVAVCVAWFIARGEHRAADRAAQDRVAAVKVILQECAADIEFLRKRSAAAGFTPQNIAASRLMIETAASTLDQMSLMAMGPNEVVAIMRARKVMRRVVRHVGLVETCLAENRPYEAINFEGFASNIQRIRSVLEAATRR
ncbi:hypothetical protein V8J38_02795 [Brevundimonas olei]|uniref:Uncharacterized protein n=1 Tax=Brevundimonas olei TaxID=657642 RepID=A0ABZ2ICP9_9CAUL